MVFHDKDYAPGTRPSGVMFAQGDPNPFGNGSFGRFMGNPGANSGQPLWNLGSGGGGGFGGSTALSSPFGGGGGSMGGIESPFGSQQPLNPNNPMLDINAAAQPLDALGRPMLNPMDGRPQAPQAPQEKPPENIFGEIGSGLQKLFNVSDNPQERQESSTGMGGFADLMAPIWRVTSPDFNRMERQAKAQQIAVQQEQVQLQTQQQEAALAQYEAQKEARIISLAQQGKDGNIGAINEIRNQYPEEFNTRVLPALAGQLQDNAEPLARLAQQIDTASTPQDFNNIRQDALNSEPEIGKLIGNLTDEQLKQSQPMLQQVANAANTLNVEQDRLSQQQSGYTPVVDSKGAPTMQTIVSPAGGEFQVPMEKDAFGKTRPDMEKLLNPNFVLANAGQVDALSKEYAQQRSEFTKLDDLYKNAMEVLENWDGNQTVGSNSAISMLAQALDPNSAVQLGETRMFIQQRGLGQAVRGGLQNILVGGNITPDLAASMVRQIANIRDTSLDAYDASRATLIEKGANYRIDPQAKFEGWDNDANSERTNSKGEVRPNDMQLWEAAQGRAQLNIDTLINSYNSEILNRENPQSGGGSAIPPSAPPAAQEQVPGAASPLNQTIVPNAAGGTPPAPPVATPMGAAPTNMPDAPAGAPMAPPPQPQQAMAPPPGAPMGQQPTNMPDAPGFAPPPVTPPANQPVASLPPEQMAGNVAMSPDGFNRLSQELGQGVTPPQMTTPAEVLAQRQQQAIPTAPTPPQAPLGGQQAAPQVPPTPMDRINREPPQIPPVPAQRIDRGGNMVPPIPRPTIARPSTPEQQQGQTPIDGGRLDFDLAGKTRGMAISPEYQQTMTAVTETVMESMGIGDLRMKVTSGGQMPLAEAKRLGAVLNPRNLPPGEPGSKDWVTPDGRVVRTGSERHDVDDTGMANTADFVLQVDGKPVKPSENPALYEKFLEEAAASGFSGLGTYSWGIHVGGGNKAFWGGNVRFQNAISRGWDRSSVPQDPENRQIPVGSGGITPQYIDNLAFIESTNRNLPSNGNGTVSGFFQFTDATWKEVTGLPGSAVDYPYEQQANAAMKFTQQNARGLSGAGFPPNPENLYIAHFLGLAGAKRFIGAPDNEVATRYVSRRAANNNKSIFFENGEPRTVGRVREILSEKGAGSGGAPQPPTPRPPIDRGTPPMTPTMPTPPNMPPPPTGGIGVDPAAVRQQALGQQPTSMPDAPGFSAPTAMAPPPGAQMGQQPTNMPDAPMGATPPPQGGRQPLPPGSDFLLNQNQEQVYADRPENQIRENDAGMLQAFVSGVAQGATLNFADELGIISREEYSALRKEFPATTTISEIIGGIGTGGALAGVAARGLAKLTAGMTGAILPRAIQAAGNTATFATEGAVAGAGMGVDPESRVNNAMVGGALGVVVGGALNTIGTQLGRVLGNATGAQGMTPEVTEVLRKAVAGDEAAMQKIVDAGVSPDVISSGLNEFRAYERMQNAMNKFEGDMPQGALTREARVANATGVEGNRSTLALGEDITKALQDRAAQLQVKADEAYANVEKLLPDYPISDPDMFFARVMDRAGKDGFVPLNGPDLVNPSITLLEANTGKMFNTNGVVDFAVFDRVRSTLGSNAAAFKVAGDMTPANQIFKLQNAMDKEFGLALNGQYMDNYAAPANSPVPAALKDARAKWETYLTAKGRNGQSTVQNVVKQFVEQRKTPEEVVNYFIGSSLVGENNVARAALVELQNIVGKDGPVMQSVKRVAVGRIFRDKFGDFLPDDRMAQGLSFYVDGEGKEIGRVMFTPEVLDTFRLLAGGLRGTGGSIAKQEARRTIESISRGMVAGTAGHGLAQGSAFISAYGSGLNSLKAIFNKVDQSNYPMQYIQQNLLDRKFVESGMPPIIGGGAVGGGAGAISIAPSLSGIGADPMEMFQQRQQQQQNSIVQR